MKEFITPILGESTTLPGETGSLAVQIHNFSPEYTWSAEVIGSSISNAEISPDGLVLLRAVAEPITLRVVVASSGWPQQGVSEITVGPTA